MDRREFLLNTAKASGVVLPWAGLLPLTNIANAQSATGKLLVYVHADGGWDSDSLHDAGPGDSPSWQDVRRADGKQRKQRAILAALQQSVDLRQRLQHADE